jgi:hypothetical protein
MLKVRLFNVHLEVWALALFSVALRMAVLPNFEFHRDELLYFSLGLHPDFGYATVPPLIGWLAWLVQFLFGSTLFAARIIPALAGVILIILTSQIARELGGSRYSSFLAAAGILCSIYFLRSFSLFMPVFIEITLWTLAIYQVIRFLNTDKDQYLYYFGIIAGFALLNKYLAIMLFAGLLILLPFTPYRNIFKRKAFFLAIGMAFLIFLPNLLWQLTNGLPVLRHMGDLYDHHLVHMDPATFLSEQLIMPFAATALTIAGLVYLLGSRDVVRYRFLGMLAVFIIGSLLLLKGKGYYTLGIFPLLTASGAAAWDKWLVAKLPRIMLPVIIIVVSIPLVPIGLPVLNKEEMSGYFNTLDEKYGIDLGRRFEDGTIHPLPQDYADMIGWNELVSVAAKAWGLVEEKDKAFIYCENYGQAGAITILGRKYGLPEAVSFHESFIYWIPEGSDVDINTAVYINSELGEDVKQIFRKITIAGSITDPLAREYRTTVYLCEDPVVSFSSFWNERVRELRE